MVDALKLGIVISLLLTGTVSGWSRTAYSLRIGSSFLPKISNTAAKDERTLTRLRKSFLALLSMSDVLHARGMHTGLSSTDSSAPHSDLTSVDTKPVLSRATMPAAVAVTCESM